MGMIITRMMPEQKQRCHGCCYHSLLAGVQETSAGVTGINPPGVPTSDMKGSHRTAEGSARLQESVAELRAVPGALQQVMHALEAAGGPQACARMQAQPAQ
jgi:hypothetical protein